MTLLGPYALGVGNLKAKVLYTALLPSQVKCFPPDLTFGPSSSFGIYSLRRVLDVTDAISFDHKCVRTLCVCMCVDACACV